MENTRVTLARTDAKEIKKNLPSLGTHISRNERPGRPKKKPKIRKKIFVRTITKLQKNSTDKFIIVQRRTFVNLF